MDNFLHSNVKNFRYERKFFINGVDRPFIETKLKFHPAMFKEIYHQRTVNNIYFDSFNLKNYYDNLDGVGRRLKVRIRWYGDLFGVIENPVLELKLKHNLHVGKLSYPLKSFTLDKNFSMNTLCEVFDVSSLQEVLKLYLKSQSISLLNTYRRKYFLSSDGNYRVTIDTDMLVHKLSSYENTFLHKSADCVSSILELKYNTKHDGGVSDITNYFPFRMSKSSKYADGVGKIFGHASPFR